LRPAGRDRASGERQADANVELPRRAPAPFRDAELERGDRAARPDDAGELAQRAAGVVDVAEEVGEREAGEGRVLEGQALGGALDELDAVVEARCGDAPPRLGQHLRALVEPDDGAAGSPDELDRGGRGSRRDVEDGVSWAGADARDEEPAPARILPEREQGAPAVVGRAERREQPPGVEVPGGQGLGQWVSLRRRLGGADLEDVRARPARPSELTGRSRGMLLETAS